MTRLIIAAGLLLVIGNPCGAYSVLTHEAVIDSVWASHIQPLLLKRFPNATPEELKEAHAYVYGGCLIQDMGYVPFSSRMFSDLVHYARSGDFVAALIHHAETLDEYAFALGSLAHYASDHHGHPVVNHATALIYPKLRAKFGDVITYEDSPPYHLKTEFSFDVVQVAQGLYAQEAYHDFIGFQVSKTVLERGFQDTYGIDLKDIFSTLDLGIGTYRFTVSRLIPEMTKAAWQSKRKDIEKMVPGVTRSKFLYTLSRRRYESEWGTHYHKPGIFARFLSFTFRIMPKFGPFKVLAFGPVPTAAEQDFLRSLETTVEQYRKLLAAAGQGHLNLTNYNLDTGKVTYAGEYRLADQAYARLVDKLAEHQFANLTPELQKDIVTYFSRANSAKLSEKTRRELEELKAKQITTQADDSYFPPP